VGSLDQTAMYVRNCYAPMYAKLCELFTVAPDSSKRRRYAGAIVTGTTGIGNSFMSSYTTYRLVKEELCTVVYNFATSRATMRSITAVAYRSRAEQSSKSSATRRDPPADRRRRHAEPPRPTKPPGARIGGTARRTRKCGGS
jgi:hypothetical protein